MLIHREIHFDGNFVDLVLILDEVHFDWYFIEGGVDNGLDFGWDLVYAIGKGVVDFQLRKILTDLIGDVHEIRN